MMSETKNDITNPVQRLVKKAGEAYYFSHETIGKMDSNKLEFIDNEGNLLKPSYFGAGMHGMNGTLKPV